MEQNLMKRRDASGTSNLYGVPRLSNLRMIDQLRAGLPSKSIPAVEKRLGLSRARLARVLDIPERTLTRRLRQPRLTAGESDRLDRLIRIFEFAVATLGTDAKAAGWLSEPNGSLAGIAPLD